MVLGTLVRRRAGSSECGLHCRDAPPADPHGRLEFCVRRSNCDQSTALDSYPHQCAGRHCALFCCAGVEQPIMALMGPRPLQSDFSSEPGVRMVLCLLEPAGLSLLIGKGASAAMKMK